MVGNCENLGYIQRFILVYNTKTASGLFNTDFSGECFGTLTGELSK